MTGRYRSLIVGSLSLICFGCQQVTKSTPREDDVGDPFAGRVIQIQLGLMHNDDWSSPGLSCGALSGAMVAQVDYPTNTQAEFSRFVAYAERHNRSVLNKNPQIAGVCEEQE